MIGAYGWSFVKQGYAPPHTGWMQYEWYITEWYDDLYTVNATLIGTYTCDGATYTLYHRFVDGASYDFEQIKAIRAPGSKRLSGTISLKAHFDKWRSLGYRDDRISRIALTCETWGVRNATWSVSSFDIPPTHNFWFNLVNKRATDQDGTGALAYTGSAAYGNSLVVGEPKASDASHLWKTVPQSNGWFNLVNRKGEQLATAKGGLYVTTAAAFQKNIWVGSGQTAYDNALWKWVNSGNGWYNLVNKAVESVQAAGNGAFYVHDANNAYGSSSDVYIGSNAPSTWSNSRWQVHYPAAQP